MSIDINSSIPKFLQGGGKMGQIIYEKDWTSHSLGKPENWPMSLKISISNILKTAFPKFIYWGRDLICFYNDAFRPSLGKDGKHPSILGEKAEVAWPETWEIIKPLIDQVLKTGKPTWNKNQLIPIYRNGKMENVYWTFSYSALLADDENIKGVMVTCTETTEEILNLQRLEESEDLLKFAIDAAELGTWDYNPHTNRFNGNDRLKSWFGISTEDEIELTLATEAMVPRDRDRVTQAIKRALEGVNGGKYDITYSIENKKTHEIKIVRALGRAWFNGSGEAYRFNGTLHDVTEQEKSAEKLRMANQQIKNEKDRFKNIIHNAPVGIAIFKGEQCIVEMANPFILAILDKTSEELEGQPLYEVLPEIENGVSPLFEEVLKNRESVLGTELILPIKRKGKIVNAYFNFILHPLNKHSDDVLEVMFITNEVTDYVVARNILEENESQFKNLVLQSPIAMAILRGENLVIEMANNKLLNHFWKRSWDNVIGKRLIEVFPELEGQEYVGQITKVLRTGQTVQKQESKAIVVKDNETFEFYVDYIYLPLREVDGSISGVMLTVTDVTDQFLAKEKLVNFSKEMEELVKERTELLRKANDKLHQSVKKLEYANAELESFTYVSSHDLQEPLRKIQVYTSRILEQEQDNLSKTCKNYFEKISVSASRMRILIDDLLTFSLLEENQMEFEPTELNEVFNQVVENLSSRIENSGAKVSSSSLPKVQAIPFQMRQVFSNLLGNALKFSKENIPPVINISTETAKLTDLEGLSLNKNNAYHKIIIEDNGIGFEEEQAEKIFEVFKRLHDKSEYEGTGMGLSIVKKIILNHNGAIEATGTDGQGAIFTIYLPQ
ncbi:PAS domain-containing protein [Arenibacter sp. BSSL-BM3]|uniref:histidine kinase n=1 Tax=Arenibacter arenosicollis TaxID=2762274 RepID=A0ABR7QRT6_9FLAO|nr:PAS domain-containing protein [Arenibacter arenosicollis]MBC8769774.1 PAS domain-containing protein [Arenibacter arenosicollis]